MWEHGSVHFAALFYFKVRFTEDLRRLVVHVWRFLPRMLFILEPSLACWSRLHAIWKLFWWRVKYTCLDNCFPHIWHFYFKVSLCDGFCIFYQLFGVFNVTRRCDSLSTAILCPIGHFSFTLNSHWAWVNCVVINFSFSPRSPCWMSKALCCFVFLLCFIINVEFNVFLLLSNRISRLVFFLAVHFAAVFFLSTTWNDLFCTFADNACTWRHFFFNFYTLLFWILNLLTDSSRFQWRNMQVEFEVFYFAKLGRDQPVQSGLYINKEFCVYLNLQIRCNISQITPTIFKRKILIVGMHW